MVICKDDGNLSATDVRAKTDENGVEKVVGFLSTYDGVEIKTDGGPGVVEIAQRVHARRDKTATLRRVSEHTKRLERWNVRMEKCRLSCERITWMYKSA